MSIFDAAFRHMANCWDRLQSMLPGQQSRIGAPVDCELPVTIDEVHLKELAEAVGREGIAASVRAFARDLNVTADKMRTQLAAGDASGVRQSAHRMKGLLSQFGASELAQLAAKLEATAADDMCAASARLLNCVPMVIKAVQWATRPASVA